MPDSPIDAKSIFLAAVDMADAAERAAFVERSCGDDAALRKRVDDLLRAYGQPDGPLDKLAAALASTEISEPIREQVGATIGPYKLMEQIGEGGFGLVFVAEQQEPIRRKVALKIIKPGMDTRDVIARFEAERQALALMDHPNIARVLDAGTTASGRPYFVMELVRGVQITDYCDQSQLTPRERLALFIDVCNAVQHAHQKGIIHRDIKPSNVLVTLHDDRPVVKVIDFGVAKALHQHLTEKTIYTRFAQMIGTLLYMSPEQAQMSGLDIDTRSDIYSLGVLLYELLTGSTPLDKRRIALAAYDEMLKIIREEEAPKPSVRLSQSTDTLPSIAALRKTEPARLKKMFDGDVDWIAMKALEKDRTRRYETANAFAADVRRYLNDEPVEASPPSTVYRLRKFARKHRTPVLVVAAIAALLLVGITITTRSMVLARRSEQAALRAEQEARAQRDAKTAALKAEAEQRAQVERELAKGVLRPIALSDQEVTTGELRSFAEWSSLRDPSLRLRILEIALEDPQTASRIEWRAERAIQSSVALSPKQRVRAIELMSAKQRDLGADPKIRAAACRLAVELGSTDLPAWAETCDVLIDPADTYLDNMVGLVVKDRVEDLLACALKGGDLLQIVELKPDPLIGILATSSNEQVLQIAANGLARLAPRMDRNEVERTAIALLPIAEQRVDKQRANSASSVLVELVPRLGPQLVKRATNAYLAMLEVQGRGDRRLSSIVAILDAEQLKRAARAYIALFCKNEPGGIWLNELGFRDLVPRLDAPEVQREADMLIGAVPQTRDVACTGLASLGARLDEGRVRRAADALISCPGQFVSIPQCDALLAISPNLRADQAEQAWNAITRNIRPGSGSFKSQQRLLAALVARLEPIQVRRAGDVLISILEDERSNLWSLEKAKTGLIALATRLESNQVQRTKKRLVISLNRADANSPLSVLLSAAMCARTAPRDNKFAANLLVADLNERIPVHAFDNVEILSMELNAALPLMDREQVGQLWNALAKEAEKDEYLQGVSEALAVVAPKIDQEILIRTADRLIARAEEIEGKTIPNFARERVIALAPRLDPARARRVWDGLMAVVRKLPDYPADNAYGQLAAIAGRLEPSTRDRLSIEAITILLDYSSLFQPTDMSYRDLGADAGIQILRWISSPRPLARLFSHPGCVGVLRDRMLQRFEELVLHNGKPVFLNPAASEKESSQTEGQLPTRRFYNQYEVAAWAEKNWPDFDLQTNYPATWHGLH